ncbi:hypothetical protein JCM19233_2449 [Vibrio astriarenae]|nr:hypothetical protein JCM19233_2449 [Vibrio sp. C7]
MNIDISAAVITTIQITPTIVGVVKGQSQQVIATATYSDGSSSEISNSVTWSLNDIDTAIITPSGSLSGVEVGSTTITATKDGIISDMVRINVCSDLGGACIDTFDVGGESYLQAHPQYPT